MPISSSARLLEISLPSIAASERLIPWSYFQICLWERGRRTLARFRPFLRRSMCYDGQHTWRKYWVEVFATVALQMTGTAPSKQHPFVFLPYRGCQLHPFTSTDHSSGFAVNTNRIYSRPRSQFTALISRLWDAREIIPLCLCRMTNTSATIVDNSLVLHWQQRNWSITNLSKTPNLSSYKKTHSTRWCIQNSFPCSINNKNFRPDRESIWFARASEFVGWVCEIPNWRCALCRKEIEFYKMAWIIWVHQEVVFIFMEWTEQHHNSQVGFRLKNPFQLEKFYCRQKNRLQKRLYTSIWVDYSVSPVRLASLIPLVAGLPSTHFGDERT